jgi:hypothetical protein
MNRLLDRVLEEIITFWGFILAVLFTCYQAKVGQNSSIDVPSEMECLLLAAG